MKLSHSQQVIYEDIIHFFLDNSKKEALYVFSGVAGSGKSTIIKEINDLLIEKNYTVANVALTGKAANVMRSKGVYNAQTVHSFLYKPLVDLEGNLIGFTKKSKEDFDQDFIIADEGSMLSEEIIQDLYDLGMKILVVGDVNQLPSISKNDFNVMDHYDSRLEEIHRQAADNPIILLSQHILNHDNIPSSFAGDKIKMIDRRNIRKHLDTTVDDYGTILCGMNKERVKLNNAARSIYGRKSRLPMVDDKIICLKNNGRNSYSIYNGDIFYVKKVMEHPIEHKGLDLRDYMILDDQENNIIKVTVDDDVWHNGDSKFNQVYEPDPLHEGEEKKLTLDRFDFGYAITVWKAQGSEYDNVLFVDENVSFFCDQSKFRYTAVTRSKNLLTIAK